MFHPSNFRLMSLGILIILLSISALFGQWQPDKRLSTKGGYLGGCLSGNGGRCIVVGPSGVVHLVYSLGAQLYYKRSTDDGFTWTASSPLTDDTLSSGEPSIGVSGSNVYVEWQTSSLDGERTRIYFKRSSDGGKTWGQNVCLAKNDYSVMHALSLAASDRFVYATWVDIGLKGTFYKCSSDGGVSWSDNIRLDNDEIMDLSEVTAIAASGSNVHVASSKVKKGEDIQKVIYYKRSTDSGVTWSSAMLHTNCLYQTIPVIEISGTNVYIFWVACRQGDKKPRIYYKRSKDSGVSWGPDMPLTDDKFRSVSPSVAVFGINLYLVWINDRRLSVPYGLNVDGEEIKRSLYYKCSSDGGTNWTNGVPITPFSPRGEGPECPCIGVSNTSVHLVWQEDRSGETGVPEIYYKRKLTGK